MTTIGALAGLALFVSPHDSVPHCRLAGKLAVARASVAIAPAPGTGAPLEPEADIPLPGPSSRFDYQSLEPRSGRLFISHMGAGRLIAFDVRAGRILAQVDGLPRITGVLAVPAEHRVYASAPGDRAVAVLNDTTLEIVARVHGFRFPDGIAYAPLERRIFVSDEAGGQDVVVDAASNAIVARIELGGEAGNTMYDEASHCVIVAVQTANELAVIDPASAQVVRRVAIDQAVRFPHGVSIDAAHRLAFIAGQESGTLGVLDLERLVLEQVLPVGSYPDVLAFDGSLERLYVASETGVVAVFQERGRSLEQLGWYRAPSAHSVAVDPATHRVYLPLERVAGHPVLRILVSTGRSR